MIQVHFTTILTVAAFVLLPCLLIIKRVGLSGWWVLLIFVPGVNIFTNAIFALVKWPIEEELDRLRSANRNSTDRGASVSWEIKQLQQRVSTIQDLSGNVAAADQAQAVLRTANISAEEFVDQTREMLQQFISRVQDATMKQTAEDLLKSLEQA